MTAEHRAAQLRTSEKVLLLSFLTAVYLFSYFHRVAIPGTVFDELQAAFATEAGPASATRIALLESIFLFIYAGMQMVVGVLVDKLGAGRVLLTGGAVMTLASALFPLSQSMAMLYGTRVLLAVGASLLFLSVVKQLDLLVEGRNFPIVFGVILFFGYSGGLVGTLPFERLVNWFGWRAPLLGVAAVCGTMLIGAAILLRKSRQLGRSSSGFSRQTLKEVCTNRLGLPIVISGSFTFGIYFLVQVTIGKKLLQDCYGFGSAGAASMTFTMMLIVMVFTFLSGFLVRFLGDRRKPVLIASTTIMVVAEAALALDLGGQPSGRMAVACYIAIALAGSMCAVFCCVIKEVNPPEAAASSVGVLNFVSYLMVAALTWGAGLVLDCFDSEAVQTAERVVYPSGAYRVIFLGCTALSLVSWLASLKIRETHGRCQINGAAQG